MADKQGGLLVTLGKRLLGFNTSSAGCCGSPKATEEVKAPEVVTEDPKAAGASCCAPSCCTTDASSDATRV